MKAIDSEEREIRAANQPSKPRLWQIGNCEECGGALFASDVNGMTLPVKGQRHEWCRTRDERTRRTR